MFILDEKNKNKMIKTPLSAKDDNQDKDEASCKRNEVTKKQK